MRFINNNYIFISFFSLIVTNVKSQIITPYALNMGGGYSDSYILEWSIGESASIDYFLNIKNGLNTGVLQPKNRFRKVTSPDGPAVFGNQIMIYPNLTSNLVYFKGNFTTSGNLEIQLVYNNSSLITTHYAGKVLGNYQTSFTLEKFPDGLFYIKVYFKPELANLQVGIYKIVKVSN